MLIKTFQDKTGTYFIDRLFLQPLFTPICMCVCMRPTWSRLKVLVVNRPFQLYYRDQSCTTLVTKLPQASRPSETRDVVPDCERTPSSPPSLVVLEGSPATPLLSPPRTVVSQVPPSRRTTSCSHESFRLTATSWMSRGPVYSFLSDAPNISQAYTSFELQLFDSLFVRLDLLSPLSFQCQRINYSCSLYSAVLPTSDRPLQSTLVHDSYTTPLYLILLYSSLSPPLPTLTLWEFPCPSFLRSSLNVIKTFTS